ncbi:MAG: class I SAM-dependent methyltransferase [Paracoccaceae bacterium]
MIVSRLTLAIETGIVALPADGKIAVFHPTAISDISALPKDQIEIIQGFYPAHQAFLDRGYSVSVSADGNFTSSIVFLPRSKTLAKATVAIASAVAGNGTVVIDGQKTDGIGSILKGCRDLGADVSGVYSKAHGKLFTISGGDFSSWRAAGPTKIEGGFVTDSGVFSADAVDRGSAVLAACLPDKLKGKVADLGAGWGYLSHQILQRTDVVECHLIEAEHVALSCARLNITDARAIFHWADATTFSAVSEFDVIITNPPFHTGRVADHDLGRNFISAASRLLSRRGVVWLVANRHLPYEQHLSAAFKEVVEVTGDASFKVFRAAIPRPQNS